jgi:hypothetical protein
MAVVRTCELDARSVPLNMRSEIIIIIIVVVVGGGGGDGGGGGVFVVVVLYFVSYWLERELLCINNVANFFSISLLNYFWKMRIYSKHMDRVGVRRVI